MLTTYQAYFIGEMKNKFYYQKAIVFMKNYGVKITLDRMQEIEHLIRVQCKRWSDKSQFKEILKTYLYVYKVFLTGRTHSFDHIALITQDTGE